MPRALRKITAAGLAAVATIVGADAASAQTRYVKPSVNGAVVDWCFDWARNCGWSSANSYCQLRGHPRALSWNTYNPGRTWVVGRKTYCNGPLCQGFSQVTCAASRSPGPRPSPGIRVINKPQMNGAAVDWCASWATDCGWGGANQLCRQYGLTRAASWNTYNPGRTWVIGSSRFCEGPVCQGFSKVHCQNY